MFNSSCINLTDMVDLISVLAGIVFLPGEMMGLPPTPLVGSFAALLRFEDLSSRLSKKRLRRLFAPSPASLLHLRWLSTSSLTVALQKVADDFSYGLR
ncbi:Os02g0298050 [Oryza sativa Japonica Group]|uniref:Os02g0298050 protein n=1 Tax=Oryza sativa subsp. japonica TaxID=39947 RepID=A0A0P0VHW6_ORYSJ|nr:Os02g0298050 [Oryza sativa Japonica Group]